MAVLADALEEFKAASPGGKALMLVAVVAVAGVAIYVYKLRSGGSSNAGTLVPIGGGSSGGDSGSSGGGSSGTGGSTGGSTGSSGGGSSGTGTGSSGGTVAVRPPSPATHPKPIPQPKKPAPTPKPTGNKKPNGQYVTVAKWGTGAWNSTLWGIAQHYYGNGAQWQRIAQANHISNPNALQVGQKIFVPK